MKWSTQAKRTRAAAVRRVHQDTEVPHGAFRLYYLLAYQYADEKGKCWPGQRALQKALHCCTGSLGVWTTVLCDRKHLSIETIHTRSGLARLYTLWRLIPEVETPGVAGLSEGVATFHGGVATTRNETKYYKPNTTNQGVPPGVQAGSVMKHALTPAALVSVQKELERVEAGLQAIRNQGSEVAGGDVLYTAKQKQERNQLLARQKEIKQFLGWLA